MHRVRASVGRPAYNHSPDAFDERCVVRYCFRVVILALELGFWFRNIYRCSGSGLRKQLDKKVQEGHLWQSSDMRKPVYINLHGGGGEIFVLFFCFSCCAALRVLCELCAAEACYGML